MEHCLHAHPLPNGRDDSAIESSATTHSSCTAKLSPSLQQRNESPQTRRLHLRNSGFRAPILPFRRISPLLGAPGDTVEAFSRSISNDNSPSSIEKRTLYGEDIPQTPVNILQEIQKVSLKKRRTSPKAGFGAIFEDNSGKEQSSARDHDGETSWYNGGSNDCSPVAPAMTPARRGQLREVSLNQGSPSLFSSPLLKHVKNRNPGLGKLRSSSSETATYIEHLESELASANAKLDMQPSPKTSKLRATKLRALTVENRNLKHENSEWQKNFDSKLHEERTKHLDAGIELRSNMRMLEDEMQVKEARLAELEWELDNMRTRMRDLEGLDTINHNLEKRIEALTNLLVQSPTKLDLSPASTSPVRTDPSKRTPRPRSMFSKLPPSPGGLRMPLSTVSETSFGRAKSFPLLESVESPEQASKEEYLGDEVQSPIYSEHMTSPSLVRHSQSFDGRSKASFALRSTPSSASKHTSMRSSGSFGVVSWGLPDQDQKSVTKQRRMRRFPSGSKSLKPLVLPVTTDVPFLSQNLPVLPSIGDHIRKDISDGFIDPAEAFLSPLDDGVASDYSDRRRSTTWVQEQTLKALEGKPQEPDVFGSGSLPTSQPKLQLAEGEEEPTGSRGMPPGRRGRQPRPRSLQEELEAAEVKQSIEKQTDVVNENGHVVDGDQNTISVDPTPSKVLNIATAANLRRPAPDADPTPRPSQKSPPLSYTTQYSTKAYPSIALTCDHAHGVFSRLTGMISGMKQEPFTLARRLLFNAWSIGSERLGGIGWWLLGLVYGTRWCRKRHKADLEAAKDGSMWTSDRSRTQEHPFRNHGGANDQRESWLSPPHISRVAPPVPDHSNAGSKPYRLPCDRCVEPSSRRTLRLWLQFSLTIFLAVGIAIKHGPATLLEYNEQDHAFPVDRPPREEEPLLQKQRQRGHRQASAHHADEHSQGSRDSRTTIAADSGYGSITCAETLGPADFDQY